MKQTTRTLWLSALLAVAGGWQTASANVAATTDGDVLVLTIDATNASDNVNQLNNLTDAQKAYTKIRIVSNGGYAISNDEMVKMFGWWAAGLFATIDELDLSDAVMANGTATDDSNPFTVLSTSKEQASAVKNIILPSSGTYTLPDGVFKQYPFQTVEIPSGDAVYTFGKEAFSQCTNLTKFACNATVTTLGESGFFGCTALNDVYIKTITASGTGKTPEIPYACFHNCTALTSFTVPDGVISVRGMAFYGCEKLEAINLPNTLVAIGPEVTVDGSGNYTVVLTGADDEETNKILGNTKTAFAKLTSLKTFTVPASVKYLAENTFQDSYNLTDVYILGDDVQCSGSAFNADLAYSGVEYKGSNVQNASYEEWKNNQNKPTIVLHVPDNETARANYINPFTRALNRLTEEDFENYKNKNWVKADGTKCSSEYEWLTYICNRIEWPEENAWYRMENLLKNSDNKTYNWAKVGNYRFFQQGEGGLFTTEGKSEEIYGSKDTWGWKEIMLVNPDATDQTWTDTRILEARWYTAVFPFNMSYNQLRSAYGDKVDLREFNGVEKTKETIDGEETTVYTILFNKPATGSADNDDYSDDGAYVKAHHPYMLHPSSTVTTVAGVTSGRTIAGRNIDNDAIATATDNSNLIPVKADFTDKVDGANSKADAFTFIGNYTDQPLPADIYYLGYQLPKYPLGFYHTTSAGSANNWKAFTAIVKHSDGVEWTGARYMSIAFDLDDMAEQDNTATAISGVEKETEQMRSTAVYNMAGQKVADGSLQGLQKGIYVMGGRKYVVK